MDAIREQLQALADPTRFAMFECIRGCGEVEFNPETGVAMCDVRCQVDCAPSTFSHHLQVLREADLITTERRGRRVYARPRPEALSALSSYFATAPACGCVATTARVEVHL